MKFKYPVFKVGYLIVSMSMASITLAENDDFDQWEEWITEDLFEQGEFQDFDEQQLNELDDSKGFKLPAPTEKPPKHSDQDWLHDLWEIEHSQWDDVDQMSDEQRKDYDQWLNERTDEMLAAPHDEHKFQWKPDVEFDYPSEHTRPDYDFPSNEGPNNSTNDHPEHIDAPEFDNSKEDQPFKPEIPFIPTIDIELPELPSFDPLDIHDLVDNEYYESSDQYDDMDDMDDMDDIDDIDDDESDDND